MIGESIFVFYIIFQIKMKSAYILQQKWHGKPDSIQSSLGARMVHQLGSNGPLHQRMGTGVDSEIRSRTSIRNASIVMQTAWRRGHHRWDGKLCLCRQPESELHQDDGVGWGTGEGLRYLGDGFGVPESSKSHWPWRQKTAFAPGVPLVTWGTILISQSWVMIR